MKCKDCLNIKESHFPFTNESMDFKKGFWLNTEDCGYVQSPKRDYYLRIYYCPVCGLKLFNK